jgi:hypothetical protein
MAISHIPTFEEIKDQVESALKNFGDRDRNLLEYSVDEYAYPHHIANYLDSYFSKFGYHVDCEYNKVGKTGEVKKGADAQKNVENVPPQKKPKGLRPDIIVHERGNETGNNLLVIEIKKQQARERDKDKDREKLRRFTVKDGQLRYRYGLFLTVSIKSPFQIQGEFYENGELSRDKKIGPFNLLS